MTNHTLLPRASQHKDNLSQSRSTVADVLDGKGIGILSVKSTDKVHDVVWVLKERRVGALAHWSFVMIAVRHWVFFLREISFAVWL